MSLDGSDLIVLDKGDSGWSSPSVSPNGEYIAFDKHGEPWLYEWGKTAHLFDTNRYGIPPSNVTEFSAPSWSPDSTKLAWIRLEKTEENEQKYIIIFDIKNQTFTSLYPCHDEGNVACALYNFEGSPHVKWSGDGNYLSVLNYGLDFYGIFSIDGQYERILDDGFYALEWSPSNAWYGRIAGTKSCLEVFIESADGQESHQVGCGRILHWSPDGNELIFGEKKHGWWQVNIKDWRVNQIDMPHDSEIIDWIKLPDQ
jgi:Tol biopolymer transport system component